MVLTQILKPSCIKASLHSRDKRSVIAELVDVLDAGKLLSDKNAVLQTLLSREQIRSTGIGLGVAIPHGKCKAVNESVIAIGVASQPIDFDSVDGKPVSIVVLLISPPDQTGPHIQALAKISRLMLNEKLRNEIRKTSSAEKVWDLLSGPPQNGQWRN